MGSLSDKKLVDKVAYNEDSSAESFYPSRPLLRGVEEGLNHQYTHTKAQATDKFAEV